MELITMPQRDLDSWKEFCRKILPHIEAISQELEKEGIERLQVTYSGDYRSVTYYPENAEAKDQAFEAIHFNNSDFYDLSKTFDIEAGRRALLLPGCE